MREYMAKGFNLKAGVCLIPQDSTIIGIHTYEHKQKYWANTFWQHNTKGEKDFLWIPGWLCNFPSEKFWIQQSKKEIA